MLDWGRGVKGNLFYARLALLLLVFMLLINTAYAFGIATPYLKDNTIYLEPGQYYEYEINVQNGDDLEFNIEFEYNSTYNIAVLRESDYNIEPKSYNNPFVFEIKIPEEAIPGERYELYFRSKPILDLEGMIPMNLEIKRDVQIVVVDENGLGYKKTVFRAIKIFFKELNRSGFWRAIWPLLLILAFIGAIYYIAKRFWGFSLNISSKIFSAKTLLPKKTNRKQVAQKSSFTISEARNVHDITIIIEKMTDRQFAISEIKNLLSKKLDAMGEKFLSEKVKKIKSREEILKILK